jgi:hypothetical protein
VDKGGPVPARHPERGPCWVWTGCRNPDGYGQVTVRPGVSQGVHRTAWELAAGPVPEGMSVLHVCDNPPCVRNDGEGWYEVNGVRRPRRGHLFLGTKADNRADMVAKGRRRTVTARGEQHRNARLSAEDVREIRARYAMGEGSCARLAREFGVSATTVHLIVRGRAWRHVAPVEEGQL